MRLDSFTILSKFLPLFKETKPGTYMLGEVGSVLIPLKNTQTGFPFRALLRMPLRTKWHPVKCYSISFREPHAGAGFRLILLCTQLTIK